MRGLTKESGNWTFKSPTTTAGGISDLSTTGLSRCPLAELVTDGATLFLFGPPPSVLTRLKNREARLPSLGTAFSSLKEMAEDDLREDLGGAGSSGVAVFLRRLKRDPAAEWRVRYSPELVVVAGERGGVEVLDAADWARLTLMGWGSFGLAFGACSRGVKEN
jgi:hypothetical protein